MEKTCSRRESNPPPHYHEATFMIVDHNRDLVFLSLTLFISEVDREKFGPIDAGIKVRKSYFWNLNSTDATLRLTNDFSDVDADDWLTQIMDEVSDGRHFDTRQIFFHCQPWFNRGCRAKVLTNLYHKQTITKGSITPTWMAVPVPDYGT